MKTINIQKDLRALAGNIDRNETFDAKVSVDLLRMAALRLAQIEDASKEESLGGQILAPWVGRAQKMKCATCIFFVGKMTDYRRLSDEQKEILHIKLGRGDCVDVIGRCRRHAPAMNDGHPVVFSDGWCGDHKVDENKI